jgi:hypothetical protein
MDVRGCSGGTIGDYLVEVLRPQGLGGGGVNRLRVGCGSGRAACARGAVRAPASPPDESLSVEEGSASTSAAVATEIEASSLRSASPSGGTTGSADTKRMRRRRATELRPRREEDRALRSLEQGFAKAGCGSSARSLPGPKRRASSAFFARMAPESEGDEEGGPLHQRRLQPQAISVDKHQPQPPVCPIRQSHPSVRNAGTTAKERAGKAALKTC